LTRRANQQHDSIIAARVTGAEKYPEHAAIDSKEQKPEDVVAMAPEYNIHFLPPPGA
jgi:hypothetical protein